MRVTLSTVQGIGVVGSVVAQQNAGMEQMESRYITVHLDDEGRASVLDLFRLCR